MIPERSDWIHWTHIKCRDPIPIEDENEINDCYSDMSKEARGISIGKRNLGVHRNTKQKQKKLKIHPMQTERRSSKVSVVKRNNTE